MREEEEEEVARAYLLEVHHHSTCPRQSSRFQGAFTVPPSPSTLPISLSHVSQKLMYPLKRFAGGSILASTGGVLTTS
jgi:hypothetical protein